MKTKRAFLLLVVILYIGGPTYSKGEAAANESLPVLHSTLLGISLNLAEPDGLAWDGQRLLGSFSSFDSSTGLNVTGLHEIDLPNFSMDEFSKPVITFPHSTQFVTWNGRNFLSCSQEFVWEFTPAGEEAGRYILPTSLAGDDTGWKINGMAWDHTTPGGPYLWVIKRDRLYRTRLAAEVQIDQTFDFNTSTNVYFGMKGLAMDRQNLWVAVVVTVNTPPSQSLELWKINPVDGKLMYAYHQSDSLQFYPQLLTADSQTPGGPYLYWLRSNFVHFSPTFYMEKLGTNQPVWQVIFMPFIYQH